MRVLWHFGSSVSLDPFVDDGVFSNHEVPPHSMNTVYRITPSSDLDNDSDRAARDGLGLDFYPSLFVPNDVSHD